MLSYLGTSSFKRLSYICANEYLLDVRITALYELSLSILILHGFDCCLCSIFQYMLSILESRSFYYCQASLQVPYSWCIRSSTYTLLLDGVGLGKSFFYYAIICYIVLYSECINVYLSGVSFSADGVSWANLLRYFVSLLLVYIHKIFDHVCLLSRMVRLRINSLSLVMKSSVHISLSALLIQSYLNNKGSYSYECLW